MAVEREKFYECEVKRRRVKATGGYEPFWKVKMIAEALDDNDTEFRCKNCGGAVEGIPPQRRECAASARRAQAEERLRVLRRRHVLSEGHRWPRAAAVSISCSLRY